MDLFIVLLTILFLLICSFINYRLRYWQVRGIPQTKTNILLGTLPLVKTIHLTELFREVYKEFKGKTKIVGTYLFLKPIIIVLDLDVIKCILIKDFNNFMERTEYTGNDENDPLSQDLSHQSGEKWRNLRSKLAPTFTSGKLKNMFPILLEIGEHFKEVCEKELKQSKNNVLEVYDLSGRFTTDVISSVIFGLENNSLDDKDNALRSVGRSITQPKKFNIRARMFVLTYIHLFKFFGARRVSENLNKFIMRLVTDTVELRERKNIKRPDFMDLMIEMKNTKDESGKPALTISEIAANSFIYFLAGFETSAGNMTFTLYELAKNPEIQDKLRAEIVEVLANNNNTLTYEALSDMKYLKQVTDESLRKYPALSNTTRIAKNDYKVPGTHLVIPAGTKVYIPIREIHYDPHIYDNPHEYRPDRFVANEVSKRHPQAFLSFGDGPRNCIGLRFGRLQTRVGLVVLLKSFKFSMSNETPMELEYTERSLVTIPVNGIKLHVEKL